MPHHSFAHVGRHRKAQVGTAYSKFKFKINFITQLPIGIMFELPTCVQSLRPLHTSGTTGKPRYVQQI